MELDFTVTFNGTFVMLKAVMSSEIFFFLKKTNNT